VKMIEARDHARTLSTRALNDEDIRTLQAIATAADVLAPVTLAIDALRERGHLADSSDIAAVLYDMASDVAGRETIKP
jgi:hypothetical protein